METLPLWKLFLATGVTIIPVAYAFGDSDGHRSVGYALADAAIYGGLFTAVIGLLRRRERRAVLADSTADERTTLYEAVRTATAPEDRSLDEALRRLIVRRRARARRWGRLNVVTFAGLAALSLLVGATDRDATDVALAGPFIAAAGFFVWASRRTIRRLVDLDAQLG